MSFGGPRSHPLAETHAYTNTGQVLTDVQRRVQHPVVRWMAATLDCKSAWGPNADRRGNLLKFQVLVGSRFGADLHRPPERVDGLGMPASENLDMSGLSGQVNFLAGSTIKTLDRG